ncbi:MAG: hypothetical protein QNJ22_01390, partial [Desulfosarcinaceae bacterium]|nr:hypothetical protein [Desulfosarcinaceae bacterium]
SVAGNWYAGRPPHPFERPISLRPIAIRSRGALDFRIQLAYDAGSQQDTTVPILLQIYRSAALKMEQEATCGPNQPPG